MLGAGATEVEATASGNASSGGPATAAGGEYLEGGAGLSR